jgi:D-amino peptidase
MKKIYIHTDMEGCSGIGRGEMVDRDCIDFDYCVTRLMADVNAAVDGAILGGADHVSVLDSHGGGNNFDLSLLDPRAEFDPKDNKKWWGMLDESYWGCFFIGAHAMAGTLHGFLDHTQDSLRIYNYSVNGRKFGELGQWAMVSGHFNVPMIMVSGDQCAANEAAQFFSGVETAVVKIGFSRMRAKLAPLPEAEDRIRRAAKKAVQIIERPPPFKPILPMEIKFDFTRADYCDGAVHNGSLERTDARSARKVSGSCLDFWY